MLRWLPGCRRERCKRQFIFPENVAAYRFGKGNGIVIVFISSKCYLAIKFHYNRGNFTRSA
jgi:hypothetical protein